MEYRILSDDDPSDLAGRLKQLVADGWRLQGGVAVVIDNNGNYFYFQALVR